MPSAAKSSSDWTTSDLETFRIEVELVHDPASFFNIPQLPEPRVAPIILTHNIYNDLPAKESSAKDVRLFFRYMIEAIPWAESFAVDFVAHVLRMMDFDGSSECIIHRRRRLELAMCESSVDAITDICVSSDDKIFLLVKEKIHSIYFACNLY